MWTWTNGVPAFAEPRRLFDRYVAPSGYHYDYCPDKNGQQFLVNSVVTRGSITLLADWRNHPQR